MTNLVKCEDNEKKQRKETLRDVGDKQYQRAMKIAENWPTLEVVDAKFQGRSSLHFKAKYAADSLLVVLQLLARVPLLLGLSFSWS